MLKTTVSPIVEFVLGWGYRPFFLLSSVFSIMALLLWGGVLTGFWSLSANISAVYWHAHEMIFGFASAALCGFLLTAVPSWCQQKALKPSKLICLITLFIIARVSIAFNDLQPLWLIALFNLALLPLLFSYIAPMLYLDHAKRHLVFIPIMLTYWLTQCCFYLALIFFDGSFAFSALNGAAYVLVFAIIITVKRISMMIINIALQQQPNNIRRFAPAPFKSSMAAGSFLLFALFDTFYANQAVTAWIALAAGAAQLDRLRDWHIASAIFKPYVAVMYIANLWIAIALAGLAASYLLETTSANSWRHGLYIGAIGSAIFGVFAIAGLRHSGFKLHLSKLIVVAIALISCAALVRVFSQNFVLAIGLWSAAFSAYLIVYTPILLGKTRPK